MEKWMEIRKAGNFTKIASEYGISPITARILRNRDIITPQEISAFLHPGAGALHDPMMHTGMNRVVQLLKEKISQGSKIRVIGDYDVDGICSTFILYKGLSFFGADCDYVIPHRIEDGYGINDKLIKDAFDAGIDTIITCDNGISAKSQTDYANNLGMTMIITDHHEVPFELVNGEKSFILPNADAIVDPKLPLEKYPFAGICGAYMAFQVVLAYEAVYGEKDNKSFLDLKEELTEFAALATVCDVMELKDENRSLVYLGMKNMQRSRNLGLKSLISVTGLEGKALTPYHLGFVIGPCLNASGRLDSSLRAVDLFLEDNEERALQKATELKVLNETRKDMTIRETENAFSIVEESGSLKDVLVVFLPECHESLAGIIAGKIKERYNRPAFVITRTEKGLKGSGRSIEAYDMYEELSKVKDYLSKFGGHKLAAGVSLSEENLIPFSDALNANSSLTKEDFVPIVRIDMELPLEYARIELARELAVLEPYGVGNEKPLFAARNLRIISGARIGKNRNVGKYKVADEGNRVSEMIYFGDLDELEQYITNIYDSETAMKLHSGMKVDVVLNICYQIDVNEYKGNQSVSLQIKNYM